MKQGEDLAVELSPKSLSYDLSPRSSSVTISARRDSMLTPCCREETEIQGGGRLAETYESARSADRGSGAGEESE